MESGQNIIEVSEDNSSVAGDRNIQALGKTNTTVNNFEKTEEEKQTEKLYEDIQEIMNHLPPQNSTVLIKQFGLPINTEERLNGVMNLVFKKL